MKKSTEKGKTDQFKASERKHFTKLPLLLLLNWPPPPAVPRVGQRICPSRVRYAKKKINSSIVITCPIASMKYAPALWTQGKPSAATVWKVEKSKGKRRRQHKRNKSNNVKHWVRIRLRHSVWIALSRCGGGGWSAGTGNCWPHRPRQSMERLWLLNG